MNEEALNDSYSQFTNTGYKGSFDDFKKLISSNSEALADAHKMFVDTGYDGDLDKFSNLLGVKKKDKNEQGGEESPATVHLSSEDLGVPATPSKESGKNGVIKTLDPNFFKNNPIEQIPKDEQDRPQGFPKVTQETKDKIKNQTKSVKDKIFDSYQEFEGVDRDKLKLGLRANILKETNNPKIADEADAYIDQLDAEQLMLNTQVEPQFVNEEDQQVFDNIRDANNHELLGDDYKAIVDKEEVPVTKEDEKRIVGSREFKPDTKGDMTSDYVNYLARVDETTWKNYYEGEYDGSGKKSYDFYNKTLTHTSNLNKIKLNRGMITPEEFEIKQLQIKNDFKNSLIKYPKYAKEVEDGNIQQEKLNEAYKEAKINITDGTVLEKAEAAHVLAYYNVVAPAMAAFTKFGAGVVSTTGRLAVMANPLISDDYARNMNNLIDDWDAYMDMDKAGSIYKAPEQLKGSLYTDGDINLGLLLPKLSETGANMIALLAGGEIFKGGELAMATGKLSAQTGLFMSSYLSTQNQYYTEAREQGLDHDKSMGYSSLAASFDGVIANISPQKYVMAERGVTSSLSKLMVKEIIGGKSVVSVVKGYAATTTKEALKEITEEEVNNFVIKNLNYAFNSTTNSNFQTTTSLDEHGEIITLSGILGGAGSVSGFKSSNTMRSESFYLAMKDGQTFENLTKSKEFVEGYGKEKIEKGKADLKNYTETFELLPSDMQEVTKMQVSTAILDKQEMVSERKQKAKLDERINGKDIAKLDKEIAIIDKHIDKLLEQSNGYDLIENESEADKPLAKKEDTAETTKSEVKPKQTEVKKETKKEEVKTEPKKEVKEDVKKETSEVEFTKEQKDEAFKQRAEEQDKKSNLSVKESFIHENLGRIKSSDFDHYSDKSNREGNNSAMNAKYFKKDAMPLDSQAQEMSEELGVEITPQDIVDYINDREANTSKYLKKDKVKKLGKKETIIKEEKKKKDKKEVDDWFDNFEGIDDSIEPQFHRNTADGLTEWKGEPLPQNKLKEAVGEHSVSKNGAKSLEIMQKTPFYEGLTKAQKENFDYDFLKSLGESPKKPESIAKTRNKKSAIKNEIDARKISESYKETSDNQMESRKKELESKEYLNSKESIELKNIDSEIARRGAKETPLMKVPLSELNQKVKDLDKAIEDKSSAVKTIKTTDRKVLKDKIKDTLRGIKKGVTIGKKQIEEHQNQISEYKNEVLKEFNPTKAQHNQIVNIIKSAKTPKSLEKALAKVDDLVDKLSEKDRVYTVKAIKDFVNDKKTILKRKGKRWVGKVDPSIQEFISNFDVSTLNELSRQEAKDVLEMLKGTVKSSKETVIATERAVKAQRKRNKASVFSTFYTGEVGSVSGKENIKDVVSQKYKTVIINGQLITSESSLNEFLKDNPDAKFENIPVYTVKDYKIIAKNKRLEVREITKKIFSITRHKANLRNHLSHFAKMGKMGRKVAENMVDMEETARFEMNEGISKISNTYTDKLKQIFGNKRKAKIAIRGKSGVKIHSDSKIFARNSEMIHLYNAYQTVDGKKKIDSDTKLDMDAVNKYMNDPKNAELKEYADYLINDFYAGLKERYEPLYQHLNNMKFPEGKYYPLFSTNTKGEIIDPQDIADGNKTGSAKSVIASNMIQRVKNENNLDYSRNAHEVAINYILDMERMKAYTPFAEQVNDLFNKESLPEILNLIGSRDLKDLTDHITTVITGISPRQGSGGDSKLINAIQGIRVLGALALKPASIIKQFASAARFLSAEDATYAGWLKGFIPKNIKEAKFAIEIATSVYIIDRMKGGSVDPELKRLLATDSSMLGDVKNKAVAFAMSPTTIGDIGGVLIGGIPYAMSIYRNNKKNDMSDADAREDAYQRFVKTSERTQQSESDAELSHLQRSVVGRLFTPFTTSQTQGFNGLIYSARMLNSEGLTLDEKKHHAHNVVFFSVENALFSIVSSGYIASLFNALTGGDEEEELAKGAYDASFDTLQSLISGADLKGVVLNSALNEIRGDNWKNGLTVSQELDRIAKFSKSSFKYLSAEDWDELSDKDKDNLLKILPIDAVIKTMENKKEYNEGDRTFWELFMNWKTEEEKENYMKEDLIYELMFDKKYSPGKTVFLPSKSNNQRKTTRRKPLPKKNSTNETR